MKTIVLLQVLLLASVASYGAARNVSHIVGHINAKGLQIFKDQYQPGSAIFSPVSFYDALELLFLAAKGETAKQIDEAMGFSSNNIAVPDYAFLRTKLETEKFLLASGIFTSKFDVQLSFADSASKYFKAEVRKVSSMSEKVNSWIHTKTRGAISTLIDDDSVDTALVSAVYFHDQWLKGFTPDGEIMFRNSIGEEKLTPMMKVESILQVAHIKELGANVIWVPYKHSKFGMGFIIPQEPKSLKYFVGNITEIHLADMQNIPHESRVSLSIPKFKIESSTDLKPILKKWGILAAFTSGEADFRGGFYDNFNVDEVFQKAVIDVNEEGTKAASATAILGQRSGSVHIVLDRSFLFTVCHTETGVCPFLGRFDPL